MRAASEPDVLIIGGGVGGVAAALAACEGGANVVLVERCEWLGGQFTSQAVPPDEHPWIETHGSTSSYRRLRRAIRGHYESFYPLSTEARTRPRLNPGEGWVSALCAEPGAARAAIDGLLAPWLASGRLVVHTGAFPLAASVVHDRVDEVTIQLDDGVTIGIRPELVLEASETGELLPLAGIEYRTGSEAASLTGEPSASDVARPLNMQSVTHCFAIDSVDGDHTIDRPADYERWRDSTLPGWTSELFSWSYPNPRTGARVTARFEPNAAIGETDMERALLALELWSYRRVLSRSNFTADLMVSDVTIVNWPMNDYAGGPLFDSPDDRGHAEGAKQLGLSFLYWMQTEAPRSDGGTGHPRLRLRPDIMGTPDGFAQAPYIRESRRIEAMTMPAEHDISAAVRGAHDSTSYADSVGTGSYRIDLHPTTEGDPYLDIATHPFEIPLGALLPRRIRNVIAAGKAIGTTHISNGCYRVHPAEWSIGEAAGALAAHCLSTRTEPHAVRENGRRLAEFQARLEARGVDLRWSHGERLPV